MPDATSHGFIIAKRDWEPQIQLEMGMSSFGRTAGEAWRRHIGPNKDPRDYSTYVQRWSDRGYGPLRVEVRALAAKEVEG